MALIIKDRVKETTTTTGTGTITLAGASTGFRSFADVGDTNTTYYCISNNSQFEVGLGAYTLSGTTLARTTVLSNSLGTTALIDFSAGTKDVFCTYPSAYALLGNSQSLTSTGTGSVVLNSNPTFATDITVNGATVGRGGGNIASNVALGDTPFNSPFINALNTNNIAIGNNNLSNIGSGVATLTILNGGSGYTYDDGESVIDTFEVPATLEYLSGTPIVVGGIYPTVALSVASGVVTVVIIITPGLGFVDTSTVFQVSLGSGYTGSGFSCQTATLRSASDIIAIGNGAGGGTTNSNSIYIGNGVTGTASNQVIIGDALITSTTLRGAVTAGSISVPGNAAFSVASGATTTIGIGTSSGNITIGGNSFAQSLNIGGVTGTQPITFGRSTTSQVVNIATGINNTTTVKTVNIGINGVTNSTTNIVIGATAGTSTTTINGLLKQQTKTVATLPTGSAGARSFVTNALAPSFGATVVAGGAVGVPVYHDGTSWKVG